MLRQTLAGSVESWTLSLERCFAPGGRYAWAVRARGEEAGEWSEAMVFETVSGPAVGEVARALATLRAYLATRRPDGPPPAEVLVAVAAAEPGGNPVGQEQPGAEAPAPQMPWIGTAKLRV